MLTYVNHLLILADPGVSEALYAWSKVNLGWDMDPLQYVEPEKTFKFLGMELLAFPASGNQYSGCAVSCS